MDNINGVNHIQPAPVVEAGMKAGQRIAVDLSDPEDTLELSTKEKPEAKESGTLTKFGMAAASVFIPGLGQFMEGNTKSGFAHLGNAFGTAALSCASIPLMAAAAAAPAVGMAGAVLAISAGIGYGANYIHGIVDAYKNA